MKDRLAAHQVSSRKTLTVAAPTKTPTEKRSRNTGTGAPAEDRVFGSSVSAADRCRSRLACRRLVTAVGGLYAYDVPALVTAEERFEPQRSNQEPVLVADDNADAAETLAAVLELPGYAVHVAGDGEEALEVAMRISSVACFVDIGMPKMNGYEFARELRRRHSGTAPLLVATTGWGQAEDRRRAIKAGFDVHMVKPIDLNEATRMLAARLSPNA